LFFVRDNVKNHTNFARCGRLSQDTLRRLPEKTVRSMPPSVILATTGQKFQALIFGG
jgi:hypothetical protein